MLMSRIFFCFFLFIISTVQVFTKQYDVYVVTAKVLNERSAPSTTAPIVNKYYRGP